MTAQPRRPVYDVCVVGSGAGGAMAAYELTRQGARVVVLEAGPWWDNAKDSAMLKMPWDTPLRGGSTPERPFGEHDACAPGHRQHPDARPVQGVGAAAQGEDVQHLLLVHHTHGARLTEHRLVDLVGSRDRRRVGLRRSAATRGPAGLDQDDQLAQ